MWGSTFSIELPFDSMILKIHHRLPTSWTISVPNKRVQTLASFLRLHQWNKVKSHIHDVFRDHHLQKYDEVCDFPMIAHRLHVLTRAKKLTPEFPDWQIYFKKSIAGDDVRMGLRKHYWLNVQREWVQFTEKSMVNGGGRPRALAVAGNYRMKPLMGAVPRIENSKPHVEDDSVGFRERRPKSAGAVGATDRGIMERLEGPVFGEEGGFDGPEKSAKTLRFDPLLYERAEPVSRSSDKRVADQNVRPLHQPYWRPSAGRDPSRGRGGRKRSSGAGGGSSSSTNGGEQGGVRGRGTNGVRPASAAAPTTSHKKEKPTTVPFRTQQPSIPYLDCGVIEVGERKDFRLKVKNLTNHKATFRIAPDACLPDFVTVTYTCPKAGLAQGSFLDAFVSILPSGTGEWFGSVGVEIKSHAGEYRSVKVPVYVKAVPMEHWLEGEAFPSKWETQLGSHIPRDGLRTNRIPAGVPARVHREDSNRIKMQKEIKFSMNKKIVRNAEIIPSDAVRPDKKAFSKEKAPTVPGVPRARSSVIVGNTLDTVEWTEMGDFLRWDV